MRLLLWILRRFPPEFTPLELLGVTLAVIILTVLLGVGFFYGW